MSRSHPLLWIPLAAACLGPGESSGQPFQVNQFTTWDQRAAGVAAARDHGFVVVWTSLGQDGSSTGTYARWFDGNGVPLGDEVQVNVTTNLDQNARGVATDALGRAVVVWDGPDGSELGVFARLFDADGVATGDEFQVNVTTAGRQDRASVAMAPTGEFVVLWIGPHASGGQALLARRFSSGGLPLDGEIEVEVRPAGSLNWTTTSVTTTAGLAFVAAWDAWIDGGELRVYARRFDHFGGAIGPSFQVSTDPGLPEYLDHLDQVRSDGSGAFVVSWRRPDTFESEAHFACRYGVSGSLQWCVETSYFSDYTGQGLSVATGGGMVVIRATIMGGQLRARRFASDGTPVGGEVTLATHTTPYGFADARVAHLDADPTRWVVVWTDDLGAAGVEVFGTLSPDWIFGGGLESGDTTSWSLVVSGG